jgi:YidC/Oxa1 family membrane protein insertase
MSKNLLLVFVLMAVIVIISQQFLFKKVEQAQPGQKQQTEQQQARQQESAPAAVPSAQGKSAPASTPSAAIKQASGETETVVENDLYKITFTNKGGLVKSWILKKFKDDKGNPLELVNDKAAPQFGYPLSLHTADENLGNKLNSVLYVSDAGPTLTVPGKLQFDYSDGDTTVRKEFMFDKSYVVGIQTSVVQNGSYVTALPAWPSGFGDMTIPGTYSAQRNSYFNGNDVQRLSPDRSGKAISGGRVMQPPFDWAGVTDQYFAAIFMPDDPQRAAMVQLRNSMQVPKSASKPDPNDTSPVPVLGAAVGPMGSAVSARLFVGPKALEVLETVRSTVPGRNWDLRTVVDFGRFSFVARPLFIWLHWTYDHWVQNWGWAIIILTVIINAALLPLRIMSMRSALKMQKIAPQVQSINDKYKKYSLKDPRRQEAQKEISALYKEHDVNPAGGCLPLLIQMPFLWAFWTMLQAAIELRGAHWMWLTDLSQPDHLFLIPITIIVSTLLMQRMTPQAGMNPEQARMMNLMMPLMLGFMSWSVASGLGLYWLTGTIVGIIQQWAMNRTKLGQEIRAIQEKRAAKRDKK